MMFAAALSQCHLIGMDEVDDSAGSESSGGSLNLIDVLSVPTIGAEVLRSLRDKSALRQTCSTICSVVRHLHCFDRVILGSRVLAHATAGGSAHRGCHCV
jgi:hypothetical protein